MPMQVSMEKFADGRTYVRTVSTGQVTGEEARALMLRLAPGTELEGAPMLSVMEGKVDLEPEARKAFASLNQGPAGVKPMNVAIVTPSAPLRVMLSFVIRIAGQANHTKFFSNEPEALKWLETAQT